MAQLEVLNALDVAKTQWYHFTAIVIAGMGFFTDAYDLFCISLVTKLLGRIYYHVDGSPKPGSLPPNVSAAVNGVAFVGTFSGQLFFGWLGDKMGRKKVYGITLLMMVVCSVASGLSFGRDPWSVMATLCFFRFWLGFGIGGDYPLSATIMSEYANKKTRGAFIAAVFAMQGFGIMAGGIVAIAVSAAFEARFKAPDYATDALASTVPQADYVWRIILMFGAVPAAATYYWRMKMPETARYTALVAKNAKQAAADMSKVMQVEIEAEQDKVQTIAHAPTQSFGLFSTLFLKRHGLHLLGTPSTWFLLDIAFFSQNLFQKDTFSSVGWLPKPQTMSAIQEVYRIARAQTLISLCGTVPGYWFTVALIDRIGRFTIQLLGFLMMTVFMFALAVPYHHWTTPGNHVGFAPCTPSPSSSPTSAPTAPPSSSPPRSSPPDSAPPAQEDRPRVPAGDRGEELALPARGGELPRLPLHLLGAGVEGEVVGGDVRRERARGIAVRRSLEFAVNPILTAFKRSLSPCYVLCQAGKF